MRIPVLYLAAGYSTRMGVPKLSIELPGGGKVGGMAFIQAVESGLNPVIVITKPGDTMDWLPSNVIENRPDNTVVQVICEDAMLGLSASLRSGLEAAEHLESDAVIVMLADQPLVSKEMLLHLITHYHSHPDLDYVTSGDQGVPKPPVLLARSMFTYVKELQGDQGARVLFNNPKLKGLVLEEREVFRFLDTDTPQDVEKLLAFL